MSTIKGPVKRLILTVSLWGWGPVCAANMGLNWGVHRAGNFRRLILKKSLEPMSVPWCHKIEKQTQPVGTILRTFTLRLMKFSAALRK